MTSNSYLSGVRPRATCAISTSFRPVLASAWWDPEADLGMMWMVTAISRLPAYYEANKKIWFVFGGHRRQLPFE
jgi:hypothetical protein